MRFIAALLFLVIASPAWALGIDTPLTDTAQELRAKALFPIIRCVVCDGESIADSPAQIASDMRRAIRGDITLGKSDAEITAAMVSHYGDYVLMKPPLNNATVPLWFGPFAVLFGACIAARRFFARHRGKAL